MVDLKHISKIGNGLYRMSIKNPAHIDSLKHSIGKGYNLIDTSTTYLNGNSERLVGLLIQKNREIDEKIFLISKAGYCSGKFPQKIIDFFQSASSFKADIEGETGHCLHPEYIKFQFEESLKRTGKNYIDCFLLHNPERYLKSKNLNDKELIYQLMDECFDFFDSMVSKGRLRYYGVSSNALSNPYESTHLDFRKILKLCSVRNHFKFIQIPYNFFEKDSKTENYDGKSLQQISKENGVRIIGNRPFQMQQNGKTFQLLDYEKSCMSYIPRYNKIEEFLLLVQSKLNSLSNTNYKITDFEVMNMVSDNWNRFISIDNLNLFLKTHLYPFINKVFGKHDPNISLILDELKNEMVLSTYYNITQKTNDFMKMKIQEDKITIYENTQLTIINDYFSKSELNHILIGMRKKEYVDDLKGNFTS